MKTKIYAQEAIKTDVEGKPKTFKPGEIIAEIDAPLTPEQLVNLLTSGKASDSQPAKKAEPESTTAKKPADPPAKV